MRRAFTLVEVILAVAIFIIMSAASLGVGRAILVHEREEQFFNQLISDWNQLRQHIKANDDKGWMTVTERLVKFQEQGALGAGSYALALPDSLQVVPIGGQTDGDFKTSKLQYKFFGTGAVDSGTVVFQRGSGKFVRVVVLMQWGVMVRKDG